MDELLKKELERRKEWAAYHHNKMKEEHDSLTDEQHDALSELCSLRHTIHTASEKLFSTESQEWEALEKFLPDEPDNIFDKFKEVGIPLDFSPIDPVTLPNSDDYYYVLTETEKKKMQEVKASEVKTPKKDIVL